MRKTCVVTDSVATVPQSHVDEYGIEVVPLQLMFGLEAFRDGVDMTPSQFYERLREVEELPTTATPTVGDVLAGFERALSRAESVVSIHCSGKLSSTLSTVEQASKMTDAPVHIMDSEAGAAQQCLIVLEAARVAAQDGTVEEVLKAARDTLDRSRLFLMFDTLEYLRKGGRVGTVQAWFGSALGFKPIVTLTDGVVEGVERPRGRTRGLARMIELMRKDARGRPVHVVVTHADVPEEAEALRDLVIDMFECRELLITPVTPVIGTHTGPGALGLAYWVED